MWYRVEYDKRKLQKLADINDNSAYFNTRKNRYIRLYKGSEYTELKKQARRHARRYANRTGIYTKHCDDLWWNWR